MSPVIDSVTIQREDGRQDVFSFNGANGTYSSDNDVLLQLIAIPKADATQTGWKLVREDDSVKLTRFKAF